MTADVADGYRPLGVAVHRQPHGSHNVIDLIMLDSKVQFRTNDSWAMRNGNEVVIRPIRADDESRMSRFHRSLSPDTVYARYFNVLKLSERIAHDRLDRVCHPAPPDETVLVVETAELLASSREIIGVGRLSVLPGLNTAEVAFVINDSHQRQGIGTELLRRLLCVAQARKLARLYAHILATNAAMQHICLKMGMRLTGGLTDDEVTAEIDFSAPAQKRIPMEVSDGDQ